MKSHILITGGAGFIGSHLCEKLAKCQDNIVYSLDNYSTGSKSNHVEGVIYIEGETVNIRDCVDFNPDYIYHLGEYSRVEQSFDDIETVWKYNKDGIFSVLQFARDNGSKLIYAGSSTKFGDGGLGRNQSPYAWTKATNTELVVNYGEWFNLPYAIVYFYNVYGGREISIGKYATVVALFKERVRKNKPLTVVSPGSQKRNFTHIDDIIRGITLVGEKGYGDDFGIGCQEAFSILDVAKMFKGEIEMLPERRGNRMTSDVVTDKVKALGWSSKNSLSEYVKSFLNENRRGRLD